MPYHLGGPIDRNCCGIDLNDAFSYTVGKQIKVKDARLGLLQYFFMVLIALYIILYQIMYKNGFLLLLAPSGTVILHANQPALPSLRNGNDWTTCCPTRKCERDFANVLTPPQYSPQCSPGSPPCDLTSTLCYTDFSPLDKLPYCIQSGATEQRSSDKPDETVNNLPCTYYDGTEASIPFKNTIFIASTASVQEQVAHASPSSVLSYASVMDGILLPGPYLAPGLFVVTGDLEAQRALCSSACRNHEDCIAWTVTQSGTSTAHCGLKAMDMSAASLRPKPVRDPTATSGFVQGSTPTPTPTCGCSNATDPMSCFASTDVQV